MPIAFRCDPVSGLVVTVYEGDVSVDEWREHIAAVLADPAWRSTTRSLSDMSGVRLPTLDDDHRAEMRALFAAGPLRAAGRQMAIISGGTGGPARDVERNANASLGARAIVFANLTAACIWLRADETSVTTTMDGLRATLRTD